MFIYRETSCRRPRRPPSRSSRTCLAAIHGRSRTGKHKRRSSPSPAPFGDDAANTRVEHGRSESRRTGSGRVWRRAGRSDPRLRKCDSQPAPGRAKASWLPIEDKPGSARFGGAGKTSWEGRGGSLLRSVSLSNAPSHGRPLEPELFRAANACSIRCSLVSGAGRPPHSSAAKKSAHLPGSINYEATRLDAPPGITLSLSGPPCKDKCSTTQRRPFCTSTERWIASRLPRATGRPKTARRRP